MSPRLEVDSLTHAFGQHRVLTGVYLTCTAGEVVGVLGPNGCGKTTMLKALLGVLHADSIHLVLGGEPTERAFTTGNLGYLAQEPFLPPRMRVRQAVHAWFPRHNSAEKVLEHPRIRSIRDRRIRSLSGGEQRFLEVVMVLTLPTAFAFLDEPFTEIEPIYREPLKDLIRETARAQQKGILVTDHAYRDILDVADRLQVFLGGQLHPADGEADLTALGYTP